MLFTEKTKITLEVLLALNANKKVSNFVISTGLLNHSLDEFYIQGDYLKCISWLKGNIVYPYLLKTRTHRIIDPADPYVESIKVGKEWWIEHVRDDNGNIISLRQSNGQNKTSTYDELDNLISVTYDNGFKETWTYDSHGNKATYAKSTGEWVKYKFINDTNKCTIIKNGDELVVIEKKGLPLSLDEFIENGTGSNLDREEEVRTLAREYVDNLPIDKANLVSNVIPKPILKGM